MPVTDLQFAMLTGLAAGPRHGYSLLKEAESQLGRRVAVATAYACFEVMITRGWIRSDGEEEIRGRTRRYYVLSGSGREVLATRASELAARIRLAQDRLFGMAGKATTA
ncbi:PadR family transcriptional regulator [Microbacterium rhizomatis]|uniref:PadR family transcriptional regulator n=1 Tax=Microbacterium rhizomatis TaxID=1631477 RepID=A0A5J5J4K7_9MICO|nr:PadR family transcriptional regulator [Microbacterium rhizomatis]KAA9110991.1 PadR family transcriptional regulator [Microbacterium rhizomatis]